MWHLKKYTAKHASYSTWKAVCPIGVHLAEISQPYMCTLLIIRGKMTCGGTFVSCMNSVRVASYYISPMLESIAMSLAVLARSLLFL